MTRIQIFFLLVLKRYHIGIVFFFFAMKVLSITYQHLEKHFSHFNFDKHDTVG